MYNLIKVLVKTFETNGKWQTVDLGDTALKTVFAKYNEIIAVLRNDVDSVDVAFGLDSLRPMYAASNVTLNQFLIDNGNGTLNTTTDIPTIAEHYAKYNDAFRAGYSIKPVTSRYSPDAPSDEADRDWLFLQKDGVDPIEFGKYCLAFVNGFFHRVTTNEQGIWVVDAMKSCRLANKTTLGIISTKEIAPFTTLSFSDVEVYPQITELGLSAKTTIKFNQDIIGKTVFFVLGGYLLALDNTTIKQVGDGIFQLDFTNYPLLERLYESQNKIDMSSLGLTPAYQNESMVSPTEVYTDDFIRKYLALSQSFIVVLDAADVFVEKIPLEPTRHPMRYISHQEPLFPILNGFGRMVNFWPVEDNGQWALHCLTTLRSNWVFNTADYRNELNITDQLNTNRLSYMSQAYHLKIGSNLS